MYLPLLTVFSFDFMRFSSSSLKPENVDILQVYMELSSIKLECFSTQQYTIKTIYPFSQ